MNFWVLLRCPYRAVVLLSTFLAGCVGVPHLGDSDAVIAAEDIIAGGRASCRKEITAAPETRNISYQAGNRRYEASLFVPREAAAGSIATISGLHKDGRDQQQVKNLGRTLARLGFTVLVPELVELRRLEVVPTNIDDIADAVMFLRDSGDFDFGHGIGIIGISYGTGPAVLAGARTDVAADVDFVMTLGGY